MIVILRYALEEAKYGYGYGGYGDRHEEPQPWNKWDMLHIVRYLIHQVQTLFNNSIDITREVLIAMNI